MTVPPFWIYVDTVSRLARVHREDCRYVRDRRVVLNPANWWAAAFGTREEAHQAARRMLPQATYHDCDDCSD